MKSYFLAVCFLVFFSLPVFSQTKNDTSVRLSLIEEGQKHLQQDLQEFKNDTKQEFQELKTELKDQRSELKAEMQNLREEIRASRSDSNTMFSVLIGGMLTIVFLIFWDRRTFLRPVVNELESTAKETKAIVNVLRDFAKQEPKMFEAMKKETLL